jgi:DMSO/TMAO reductase YedYZ molybdopterin-dependent catalytic subunit
VLTCIALIVAMDAVLARNLYLTLTLRDNREMPITPDGTPLEPDHGGPARLLVPHR